MVLTRSERNRLVALGIDVDAMMNMDNVPVTSTTSTATMTAPITSLASVPAATTTAGIMTPPVQQSVESTIGNLAGTDTSVTTPVYSSLTIRNEGQQTINNVPLQPPQSAVADQNGQLAGFLDLSRQLNEFQRSLQEISRAIGQQQATTANTFNGVQDQAQLPPTTGANYLGADGMDNPGYPRQQRIRPPHFSQDYGAEFSPFTRPPEFPSPPSNRVDLSKWGVSICSCKARP